MSHSCYRVLASSPISRICPFSIALFLASATAFAMYARLRQQDDHDDKSENKDGERRSPTAEALDASQVVFVLGGPGAGKGTQCQLLQERLSKANSTTGKWIHLSAGDLLRSERQENGPMASIINDAISSGRIVPAEITVMLLERAIQQATKTSGCTKFLIDGFPRSEGNVTVWEERMKQHKLEFVLNLECPEEVLVGRLLERGQTSGRSDDQIDVIRKRFHTFQEECKPIVAMYSKKNMVRSIAADQPVEAVYEQVAALFQGL